MNVELLAPAGNFSKLKTALYFGADAARTFHSVPLPIISRVKKYRKRCALPIP